jgi:hypothetical protein
MRAIRRAAVAATFSLLLLIIITAIVIASPGAREFVREHMHWTTTGFEEGSSSQLPAEFYSSAGHTVLIFATTNCAACQRALPFHQQLLHSVANALETRARVVLTSPGDDPAAYAATLNVPATQVMTWDARHTTLRRVPTILIVDRNGVVVYAREGVLNDDQQRELIGKVTSLR